MLSTASPGLLLERVDDVTVVTFAEKSLVDGQLVQQVGAELDRLDALELSKVLINFGEVEFLSSALLAELHRFVRRVNAAGGRTKVCRIEPGLVEIFSATGFDRRFEVFDEEWRALDSFQH
jgi:anti-sigma B factor antagonist